MVREEKWQPEVVPAKVVGLSRDVTVYRTEPHDIPSDIGKIVGIHF